MPKPKTKAKSEITFNSCNFKPVTINAPLVSRVLSVVDLGLTEGLGDETKPGGMCVEAAVSFALGHETGDGPLCVNPNLRDFKIGLNDSCYFNNDKDRAQSLRRIAVAQLGTEKLTSKFDHEGLPISFVKQTFKYSKFSDLLQEVINVLVLEHNGKVKIEAVKNLSAKEKKFFKAAQVLLDENCDLMESIKSHLDIEDSNLSFIDNYEYSSDNYSNFINDFSSTLVEDKKFKTERAARDFLIEKAVQVLVKMKTPGSKFLYLTKKKGK